MSSHKLQPVRGTKDLFLREIRLFNFIVDIAKKKADSFNFKELQIPIFEFSEIFERNLGEVSDVISKETYKFQDRSGNDITLRPEFTAGVVRALISNGELSSAMPQKLFSYGPLFRYDRPQKGRQRQFHQINFEIFGEESVYCDLEIIMLSCDLLKEIGVFDVVRLEINSLGCAKTKSSYEIALKSYLENFKDELSEDSKNRLDKNPLRILDSKDLRDIKLLSDAPKIHDFFSSDAKNRFDNLLELLNRFSIPHSVNPNLVRGLDYYTSTVFEFVMEVDGAQNTVLAGGRYDDLVLNMGGKSLPAIGFACGIERLMLLLGNNFELNQDRPIAVVYVSQNEKNYAFQLACNLRKSGFVVDFPYDATFKKQMKRATQINAKFVVITGEDEVKNNRVTLKDFDSSAENNLSVNDLLNHLALNIDRSKK